MLSSLLLLQCLSTSYSSPQVYFFCPLFRSEKKIDGAKMLEIPTPPSPPAAAAAAADACTRTAPAAPASVSLKHQDCCCSSSNCLLRAAGLGAATRLQATTSQHQQSLLLPLLLASVFYSRCLPSPSAPSLPHSAPIGAPLPGGGPCPWGPMGKGALRWPLYAQGGPSRGGPP